MLTRSSFVPLLGCGVGLVMTWGALSLHLLKGSGSGWLAFTVALMLVSVVCLVVVVGSGHAGAVHERTTPAQEPGTVDGATQHRARFQGVVASGAITSGMVASLGSGVAEAWTDDGMGWATPMVILTVGTLGVCVFLAIAVVQFRRAWPHQTRTAHDEQAQVDQPTV